MPNPYATTAYYAAGEHDGATALSDVLRGLAGLVKSCVLEYPTPPLDPQMATVLVDCDIVPGVPMDAGDGSYWTFDLGAQTITLHGPICDEIVSRGVQRIDYIFGCPIPW